MLTMHSGSTKILHLGGFLSDRSSGIQKVVKQLSEAQADNGHAVTVLGVREPNAPLVSWKNVTTIQLTSYGPTNFCFTPRLRQAIKRINPDIIHLHGLWMFNSLVAWSLLSCYKIVVSPHGMLGDLPLSYSKRKKFLLKYLFVKSLISKSYNCIATSKKESSEVLKFCDNSQVQIIPNGVKLETLVVEPKRQNTILYVGRLHKKKNVETLINAFLKIHNEYPGWKLRIVGDGDPAYVSTLKSLISDQLIEKVIFSGELKGADLSTCYATARVFAIPSLSENFGLVIAEAMFYKLPVIVSNLLPWSEVEEYEMGFLAQPDPDSFAKSLRDCLNLNQLEHNRLGLNGHRYVTEKFDWNNISKRISTEAYGLLTQNGTSN